MNGRWRCIARHDFEEDVLITDPCYLDCDMTKDDCGIGDDGLSNRTYYGDWMCSLFATHGPVGRVDDDAERVGTFTADTGMVCVVGMSFARKKKSDIDRWIAEHSWCATVVRGFRGTVRLMRRTVSGRLNDGTIYHDHELRVRADGIVNGEKVSFESVQTGG